MAMSLKECRRRGICCRCQKVPATEPHGKNGLCKPCADASAQSAWANWCPSGMTDELRRQLDYEAELGRAFGPGGEYGPGIPDRD